MPDLLDRSHLVAATASSVLKGEKDRFGPDAAVDGDRRSFYHSNKEPFAWLQLQMSREFPVEAVRAWHRTNIPTLVVRQMGIELRVGSEDAGAAAAAGERLQVNVQ